MKKNKSKDKSKGAAASSKTKVDAKVVANPRLVAALVSMQEAKTAYESSLITIGTICEEEQLTKAEVVASLMKARGIEKSSAESQYSRMKNIFNNPEVLAALKAGTMTIKMANEATTKKQKNPSPEQKKKNIQKRFDTFLTGLINAAKESGMDKATLILSVKNSAKKAGIV